MSDFIGATKLLQRLCKEMADEVKQLKKIIEKEYEKWIDSKKSTTFDKIVQVHEKLVALSSVKDQIDLILILSYVDLKVEDLYMCFWPKPEERVAKLRVKACRLLEKLYSDSIISIQVQTVLVNLKKNGANAEHIANGFTQRKKNVSEWCERFKSELTETEIKELKDEEMKDEQPKIDE